MMTDTEQAIHEALASKVSGVVPASLRYSGSPRIVAPRPQHPRQHGTVLAVMVAVVVTVLSVVAVIGFRSYSRQSASSSGVTFQLDSTSWLVTSLTSDDGHKDAVAKTLNATVTFDRAGGILASDGFNTYAASYRVADDDHISVGPARQTLVYTATTDHQVLDAIAAIRSLFPESGANSEIVDVHVGTSALSLTSSKWTLELRKI